MFGIVCGGRPVDTNVTQIESTKFVYVIRDAARINHIAIFLLPNAELLPEMAAAIYAKLPGQEDFFLLGALTTEKQSAIYRLNTKTGPTSLVQSNDVDAMMDDEAPVGGAVATTQEVILGISIEAVALVQQNLERTAQHFTRAPPKSILAAPPGSPIARPLSPPTSANTPEPAPTAPNDIASLANKIVTHAYNYMSSFVDGQGKVPIKAFDDWWNKFKTKLSVDPTFLNSL